MANSLDVKVVEDGYRNAVVKIVGIVTDADMSALPAISLSQFSGNDPGGTLSGLKVVDADYSGSPGLIVKLGWNAATEQPICALSTTIELRGRRHGGVVPNASAAGYDGNINLSTQGFVPGTVYGFTIVLRMVKKYS